LQERSKLSFQPRFAVFHIKPFLTQIFAIQGNPERFFGLPYSNLAKKSKLRHFFDVTWASLSLFA